MGFAPGKTLENKPNLAPTPLLDLFENYGGSFHDLDRGLKLDGAQMRAARNALVDGFTRQKNPLRSGDRVLLAVGNGPGFLVGFVAVLSAGGAPVLLHVETPPAELDRLARSYDAQFALCDAWSENDLAPFAESVVPLTFAPARSSTSRLSTV